MNSKSLITRSLSSVRNWDIFTLTQKMANLQISELNRPSSSSSSDSILNSSSSYSIDSSVLSHTKEILDRFSVKTQLSSFSRSVIDKTKSSYIDMKSSISDISRNSNEFFLTLAYRFIPGQDDFLTNNLSVPNSVDRLISLKNQLGFTLSKDSLSNLAKSKCKSITELGYSRLLVESITYNNGYYGRFLVLVELGIGCTIWYGFIRGSSGIYPPVDCLLFNPIDSYDGFLNNPEIHVQPGFEKITLAEKDQNILVQLAEAYKHEKPFNDVQIPNASGCVLMSVSMGLAIVILLSLGVSPVADFHIITA